MNPLLYRRQILALKQFFAGRRPTVLLLDDRTSADADLQVQSIAHRRDARTDGTGLGAEWRRLRVSKLRGSRFRGGFHDFTIRTDGVEVGEPLTAFRGVLTGVPVFAGGAGKHSPLLGEEDDEG